MSPLKRAIQRNFSSWFMGRAHSFSFVDSPQFLVSFHDSVGCHSTAIKGHDLGRNLARSDVYKTKRSAILTRPSECIISPYVNIFSAVILIAVTKAPDFYLLATVFTLWGSFWLLANLPESRDEYEKTAQWPKMFIRLAFHAGVLLQDGFGSASPGSPAFVFF